MFLNASLCRGIFLPESCGLGMSLSCHTNATERTFYWSMLVIRQNQ